MQKLKCFNQNRKLPVDSLRPAPFQRPFQFNPCLQMCPARLAKTPSLSQLH